MNNMYNIEKLGVSSSFSGFGAPSVIEKAQHNMVSIDIYSKLLNNRIIFCDGVINGDMASDIIAQLLYLDNLSSEPINLYINSPGGSVTAGFAIIDTMKLVKSPIYTICTGLAASMASLIFASGDVGNRKLLPHSTVMIHQPSTELGYINAADLAIQTKQLEKTKQAIFKTLADITGKPIEQVIQDADRDYWLDAEETIAYGLADLIIQ